MRILIWTIVIYVVVGLHVSSEAPWPCDLSRFCDYARHELSCHGFNSLSRLNYQNCPKDNNIFVFNLEFPKSSILRTNLDVIINLNDYFNNTDTTLVFSNVEGLDLDFFAPLRISNKFIRLAKMLRIESSSTIGLYLDQMNILVLDKCNSETYRAMLNDKTGVNVLSSLVLLDFLRLKFKSKICKYMFQNLTITELTLTRYSFEFVEDSAGTSEPEFNSNIEIFSFYGFYRLELTKAVLNKHVFQYTTSIQITRCTLFDIQQDLFQERLSYLQEIILEIFNTKAFVHGRGGVAWIKYLNNHKPSFNLDKLESNANLSQWIEENALRLTFANSYLTDKSFSFFPYLYYFFPDEDFCLFYDIPTERLVFIQFKNSIPPLSCTLAWLFRYQSLYINTSLMTLELNGTNCSFTPMLVKCRIMEQKDSLYTDSPYFGLYDLGQGIKQAQTVLFIYIRPVFSILCFVTNMLIVLTIAYNHKRRNEIKAQAKNKNQEIVLLEQTLYKYILLNSIFNTLNSLAYFIDYWIPCDPITNAEYDYPLPNSCKPRAIVFGCIATALKNMSNFSFVQISINRYLLVGKDHPGWIIKVSQIAIKKFIIYTLIVSILLSSVNYFQIDFFSVSPLTKHFLHFNRFDLIQIKFHGLVLLTILTSIHDFISYFLFCILSLTLDILTVLKLRATLMEKEKVVGKAAEVKKSRESERRSIIMVVTNSIVNFILRAPELISLIFYYIVLNQGGFFIRVFCFTYSECLVFVDIAQVFYIISLCTSLVFYIKFNSVFKRSFMILVQSILIALRIKKQPTK